MTTALTGLKVKVRGQGYGGSQFRTLSVGPRFSIEESFFLVYLHLELNGTLWQPIKFGRCLQGLGGFAPAPHCGEPYMPSPGPTFILNPAGPSLVRDFISLHRYHCYCKVHLFSLLPVPLPSIERLRPIFQNLIHPHYTLTYHIHRWEAYCLSFKARPVVLLITSVRFCKLQLKRPTLSQNDKNNLQAYRCVEC